MEKKLPKTQQEAVLAFMRGYGSITSMQAYEIGVTRLSAVIYDLRHKQGLNIESQPCKVKTRYGKQVTFCKYFLKDEVA